MDIRSIIELPSSQESSFSSSAECTILGLPEQAAAPYESSNELEGSQNNPYSNYYKPL